jgi:hypothetical protein
VTLNPIAVVDRVIEEYRDYLRTEFRARDPKLRGALERELDAAGFLAQDPFFKRTDPSSRASAGRARRKRTNASSCP